MRFLSSAPKLVLVLGLAIVGASWAGAQTFPLKAKVELSAYGGVEFKAPKWVVAGPKKGDIAVLRNDAVKGDEAFLILMLTIEEGPAKTPDWELVRKNILSAAKAKEALLTLALGDDFNECSGFLGKRMAGRLTVKGTTMSVELIALSQAGKLVTATLVSGTATPRAKKLVAEVARTATLKTRR